MTVVKPVLLAYRRAFNVQYPRLLIQRFASSAPFSFRDVLMSRHYPPRSAKPSEAE